MTYARQLALSIEISDLGCTTLLDDLTRFFRSRRNSAPYTLDIEQIVRRGDDDALMLCLTDLGFLVTRRLDDAGDPELLIQLPEV